MDLRESTSILKSKTQQLGCQAHYNQGDGRTDMGK